MTTWTKVTPPPSLILLFCFLCKLYHFLKIFISVSHPHLSPQQLWSGRKSTESKAVFLHLSFIPNIHRLAHRQCSEILSIEFLKIAIIKLIVNTFLLMDIHLYLPGTEQSSARRWSHYIYTITLLGGEFMSPLTWNQKFLGPTNDFLSSIIIASGIITSLCPTL